MAASESDWKHQEQRALDWITVGTTLLLVLVYLYLGETSATTTSFVIAAGLVGWLAIYFTEYWEAILYLPMALFLSAVSIVWFVRGTWADPIYLAAIVLHAVILVVAAYLLVREEPVL